MMADSERPAWKAARGALLCHIGAGRDLVAALREAAPAGSWVQAAGYVADVELRAGVVGEHLSLSGERALLSLVGPGEGPLMATLSCSGPGGEPGVVGGELVRARSAGVHVAAAVPIPPADAVRAERGDPVDWATVAEASARPTDPDAARARPSASDEESEETPRYKDRVDHFAFGLCDVMVARGDRLKIREVRGLCRLREIHLGAVRVLRPTEEDGYRVFRLERRI